LGREDLYGKRYILNAGQVTYKTFFERVAQKYGVAPPNTEVSDFTAGMAWRWEYIKYLITGKEPLITKETARLSRSKKNYSNAAVTKDFKHNFISLEETLSWCCEKNP
ncbi:MAG TPA: hypothetical protein VL947_10335, partial [Cytophagales bacterium]|nr:hypothetical protein [Cytophagales bacterium]